MNQAQVMDMIETLGAAQTDELPFNLSPQSKTARPRSASLARFAAGKKISRAGERSGLRRKRAKNAESKNTNWKSIGGRCARKLSHQKQFDELSGLVNFVHTR
jgi:hypothetical protein